MGHLVVAGVEDGNAYAAGQFVARAGDDVVVDDVVRAHRTAVGAQKVLAHLDTTCSQVGDVAVADGVVVALAVEPQRIAARVEQFAVADADVAHEVEAHGSLGAGGSLNGFLATVGHEIGGVLEREILKAQDLHRLRCRAGHHDPLGQCGHDALGCRHVLALSWLVVDVARGVVEIPFAWSIEGAKIVVHHVARALGDGIPRLHLLPACRDGSRAGVDRLDRACGHVPFMIKPETHLLEVLGFQRAQRRPVLGIKVEFLLGCLVVSVARYGLARRTDLEESRVGRARKDGPTAVDKQLLEAQLACFHLGQVGAIEAAAHGFPTADFSAAHDARFFLIHTAEYHGAGSAADGERTRHEVVAGRNLHEERVFAATRPPFDGLGQRIVGRTLGPVAYGVVAGGGDVDLRLTDGHRRKRHQRRAEKNSEGLYHSSEYY